MKRCLALIACLLVSGVAFGQALPNLSLLRVRYNTAKVHAKPAGELKAELDAIDAALAEASGWVGPARCGG